MLMNTKKNCHTIQDKVYSSVDEIVESLRCKLKESETDFQALCGQLIDSTGTLAEQFEAWLITIGKHEELQKWRMSEYGAE